MAQHIYKGDKIHIHSKSGTYTVFRVDHEHMVLEAKTLGKQLMVVPLSDYKCHYERDKYKDVVYVIIKNGLPIATGIGRFDTRKLKDGEAVRHFRVPK